MSDTITTSTNMAAYVGKIVKLDGECYTVSMTNDGTGAVEIDLNTVLGPFETCADCIDGCPTNLANCYHVAYHWKSVNCADENEVFGEGDYAADCVMTGEGTCHWNDGVSGDDTLQLGTWNGSPAWVILEHQSTVGLVGAYRTTGNTPLGTGYIDAAAEYTNEFTGICARYHITNVVVTAC